MLISRAMNLTATIFCLFITTALVISDARAGKPEDGDDASNRDEVGNEKQPNTITPLVMLIYYDAYGYRQTTFTDLETAKKNAPSMPLNGTDPGYIVLLCAIPAGTDDGNGKFLVYDLLRGEIDSNADDKMCEYYRKPFVEQKEAGSFYKIGFKFKLTEEQLRMGEGSSTDAQNTVDGKSNYLYAPFMQEYINGFNLNREDETYIKLYYNFNLTMPESLKHTIAAGTHSGNQDVKCPDMELGKETFVDANRDFDFDKFSTAPEHYRWRQLIPIEDFSGIYATAATCTYLNYTLVHNDAVAILQQLEQTARQIADVIDTIDVFDGGYVEPTDKSVSVLEKSEPSIPTILWKVFARTSPIGNKLAVVLVIHNKKTKRICNQDRIGQRWGWPEQDRDDGAPGTVYYCLYEKTIVDTLKLPRFQPKTGVVYPFDLRKMIVDVDVLVKVRKMAKYQREREARKSKL